MPRRDDLTVVIPCFNHGRYLGEAVESALAQEGGEPALIVVDDGSTEPETEAALAELPDSAEVIRQANAGPAAARNAGFERAETPYVLPLDADDRLPPGALSHLHAALESDPRAAYAYGVMHFFEDWSGEVRFPEYDPFRLLYRPIVGWLGMVRRAAWEEIGGFDAALQGFEDWDFTLGAIDHGWHGHRLDRVVLDYRKHGRSGLESDRRRYRRLYRALRAKHAALYARSDELAAESDLGPLGRLLYRSWWAWRPLPASAERMLFALHFRRPGPGRVAGDPP